MELLTTTNNCASKTKKQFVWSFIMHNFKRYIFATKTRIKNKKIEKKNKNGCD